MYQAFLRSLSTDALSRGFLFHTVTNFTKVERLHRAASRSFFSCLLFSLIPLLFSEASLPPLRDTLTHFSQSNYGRALRLPTNFFISSLARLGVKPRLSRSSWRSFASTHPLMAFSREILFACFFSSPCNLPSFTVKCTLFSPCSRSDPPVSRQVQLSLIFILYPTSQSGDPDRWFCYSSFWQNGSGVLAG